ncbi:hypothetical protein ADUPG1_003774, partial [Aduncisulcus paluster]
TLSSSLHQRHESEVDTDPTRAQVSTSDLPSPNSTLSTIELPPMEPNPHLGTTTNSFISPSRGDYIRLSSTPPSLQSLVRGQESQPQSIAAYSTSPSHREQETNDPIRLTAGHRGAPTLYNPLSPSRIIPPTHDRTIPPQTHEEQATTIRISELDRPGPR